MFKFLRVFTLIFALLSFCGVKAEQAPHPLKPLNISYDVLHYDADIYLLNNVNRRSSGVSRISVLRSDAATISNFYFHLRGLEVDSVFCNDDKVDIQIHGEETDADFCYFFPFTGQKDDFYSGLRLGWSATAGQSALQPRCRYSKCLVIMRLTLDSMHGSSGR
jgi:hypothetical protein